MQPRAGAQDARLERSAYSPHHSCRLLLRSDLFDRAIGSKDLPDEFAKPSKQLRVGLVEKPLCQV